jgi:hypothetical protein
MKGGENEILALDPCCAKQSEETGEEGKTDLDGMQRFAESMEGVEQSDDLRSREKTRILLWAKVPHRERNADQRVAFETPGPGVEEIGKLTPESPRPARKGS